MESGAGKHWTEEEVKALLSVWSEKNIRKQLHGTLRNKGIFIYIAKRLQELGVCRDWKQCRAKYKNLKYEYRTVKYAHNSGDVTKTMKFFHDLDAILRYEPVTQLAAEENGRCSATETQLNTSPTTDNTQELRTKSLANASCYTSEDCMKLRQCPSSEDLAVDYPVCFDSVCPNG
uniref:Myb/SANT-like DNA-binding domain-containing protein n=1 Tax=Dromaius novaehollandiae TaxID=8790 RepID=A0A8C4JYA1_DRONO